MPDVYLICREGCLNGELECEGEDAKGKYTKEEAGCYDVLRHVGDEEEVGEHENADNWAEAAKFCDLHHLASLLGRDAEHDGAEGPGEDDEGAAQSSQLVAVPNTGAQDICYQRRYLFFCLSKNQGKLQHLLLAKNI